jgi:hypothetical protein
MTKHWALDSPLSGETFDAPFETAALIARSVDRHPNTAKASGQFADDFRNGNYSFECPR